MDHIQKAYAFNQAILGNGQGTSPTRQQHIHTPLPVLLRHHNKTLPQRL
jgi:hypothetical protein